MSDHPEGFYMDEPIGVNTQLKKIAKLKVALQERDANIEALRAQVERSSTFIRKHIEKWDYCEELKPSLQVLARVLPKPPEILESEK